MIREPHKNDSQTTEPGSANQKQRRFRIVKLEERIAPGGGKGNGSNATCGNIASCHKCGGYTTK